MLTQAVIYYLDTFIIEKLFFGTIWADPGVYRVTISQEHREQRSTSLQTEKVKGGEEDSKKYVMEVCLEEVK